MLGRRLAQLRKRSGWTQARLAAVIGEHYERSMISHVESGRATLHFDALVKVARALDVSIDYLAGLTEDPTPADDRSPSDTSRLQRVPLREFAASEGRSTDLASAPPIGHLAFRREWMETHRISPDDCSAIEVPDDLMEPTIQAGAWVLVDHRRATRQGSSIFAVNLGDKLYVRRAVYSDQDWLLAGDNPKCQTLAWPGEARVLGQVVWMGTVL